MNRYPVKSLTLIAGAFFSPDGIPLAPHYYQFRPKPGRNREITDRYRSGGTTYAELGREFGISTNRVRTIVLEQLRRDEREKVKRELSS